MVNKNKFISNNMLNTIVILSLFLIIVYVIIYWLLLMPLFTLYEYQTKEWITNLTDNIILGVNDYSKFKNIERTCNFISFWYCYWFFQTKRYTVWILFNLQNKFSDTCMLNVYLHDFYKNTTIVDKTPLKFSNVKTSKINDILLIKCGNAYRQEIDFNNNLSRISINTPRINMMFELDIDDYTTNQGSFLPLYQRINFLVNSKGTTTNSPEEWMSDNPFIGTIKHGFIQNDVIEKGGSFWFDNFIGCNNYFLGPYIWFVILNDDWMIYLLWFDTYKERNNMKTIKPILIKDRKTNTFLYAGTVGHNCKNVIPPLDSLNYLIQPVSMTYQSNKEIGVADYDDYSVKFTSSKINVNISSIPGESHQVFKYKYYVNEETDEMRETMNSWDKKYYDVLSNINYTEYVTKVNVEIEYNGKTERFVERQIIDTMYPENYSFPTKIKYE